MRLAATGTHLSPEFGMTVCEIERDGLPVDKKIEILISADMPVAISKSMGLAVISFAEYFAECVPEQVFNVGVMGVENALHADIMSLVSLEESIGFKLGNKYAVGTFHPVTLEDNTAEQQAWEMLKVIDKRPDITYFFTKANADTDGKVINRLCAGYGKTHSNFILADSLGMRRYLSALKYASFVIGNSSSGLIEAPSFHIPTIDIGDRQKGRMAGESVIWCGPTEQEISDAIDWVLSDAFRDYDRKTANPYDDGNTSDKIIEVIRDFILNSRIDIKKKFQQQEI